MKKLFLTLIAVGGFMASSFAAYYYQKTVGISDYNRDATGKKTVLHADSNKAVSSEQTLPFAFTFYGNTFNSYYVTANGYITFESITSSVSTNTSIPQASGPNNAIYAFWDNIKIQKNANGTPDAVYTYTTGSSPNQVHTIQWFSATNTPGSGYVYTTIRLHESGKIEIIHDWAVGTGNSATVGIENGDGSQGIMVGNSPSYEYPAGVAGDYTVAVVYTFMDGTQPALDVKLSKLNLLSLYGMNGTADCKGSFSNLGANTVNSVTIAYSVDGGNVESANIGSLNLKGSGEGSYNFVHTKSWTPNSTGVKTIKVWIVDVNGMPDDNHSNDTLTQSFTVIEKTVPRVVLHEIFTSSTCGPCVPGNAQLSAVLDGKDPKDYAVIKYQMNWPGNGDPYYTLEGNTRRNLYAVSSIPDLNVDGKTKLNPTGYTSAMFDAAFNIPSIVEIEANHWVDKISQTLWATAKITAFQDISNVRAFIVINEKVTDKNVGTNGEAEFYHVMKKMMTTANGQSFTSIKANTPVSIAKDFKFPGIYDLPDNAKDTRIPKVNSTFHTVEDFDDLEVVVFLQNTTTKEVFQAANSKSYGVSVGKNVTTQNQISVFPNPSNNQLGVDFMLSSESRVRFEIVNQLGQVFKSEDKGKLGIGEHFVNFSTVEMPNGVYFLNIISNGSVSTQRFVVAH